MHFILCWAFRGSLTSVPRWSEPHAGVRRDQGPYSSYQEDETLEILWSSRTTVNQKHPVDPTDIFLRRVMTLSSVMRSHSCGISAALGQEDLNLPTFVKIGEPTDEDSARLSSDIHQRSAAFGEHQDRENHGIITILILCCKYDKPHFLTLLFLLVVLLFLLLHSFHFSSWTSLARSDSRSQQTDRPGQEGRCGSACRTGQSGSPVDLSEPDNETGQCPEDSWKSFESVCIIALVLIVDS